MEPGQKAYEAVKQEGTLGPFATLHPDNKAYFAKIEAALVPPLPADVAGLVERLEATRAGNGDPAMYVTTLITVADAHAAASTIRALVAANEGLKFGDKQMQGLWACDREERDKADAKLREAVEFIREMVDPQHRCEQLMTNPPKCIRSFAAERFLATMEKPHDP
jgi:hypothetical protein